MTMTPLDGTAAHVLARGVNLPRHTSFIFHAAIGQMRCQETWQGSRFPRIPTRQCDGKSGCGRIRVHPRYLLTRGEWLEAALLELCPDVLSKDIYGESLILQRYIGLAALSISPGGGGKIPRPGWYPLGLLLDPWAVIGTPYGYWHSEDHH